MTASDWQLEVYCQLFGLIILPALLHCVADCIDTASANSTGEGGVGTGGRGVSGGGAMFTSFKSFHII